MSNESRRQRERGRGRAKRCLSVRITQAGDAVHTRLRCLHSRAAARTYHSSYEAKRRERRAPIFIPRQRAYPPDLQLRSPMPRAKSLHALSRRSKSIDTYTLRRACFTPRRVASTRICTARQLHPTHTLVGIVEQRRTCANNAVLNNKATVVGL